VIFARRNFFNLSKKISLLAVKKTTVFSLTLSDILLDIYVSYVTEFSNSTILNTISIKYDRNKMNVNITAVPFTQRALWSTIIIQGPGRVD